ncbi:MAG: MBOAT family protein [Angelakisella sp.]|jgi:alginate O-acetyltransferase complex protein AlgI|nr:MBOAT family protein [Angelakisella sp.]
MVFSSILFLFRFFPVAMLLYYLAPRRYKNLVLLLESLVFYSWGEVRYFPIMIASILVDYIASNGIQRHRQSQAACRGFLLLSVVFNLGMLGFFKYTNFLLANLSGLTGLSFPTLGLTLPLGISFYTFQTMSYTIDVYRGKVRAENNIIDFGAFVVLFPQLIAGPIVRYTDVSRELKSRSITPAEIQEGVDIFIRGLGRKVLIANNIGALWTEVSAMNFDVISTPLAWLGIVAYTFQIYFDFSGYSQMAIGLGRMLGFRFPQNFDDPYIAKSATEFWRRWHMTLGSWFREYLYIPLGGNRCSFPRQVFNLFVVWAATGLWHGASWNFVLWGLYFFVFLVLEKAFLRPYLEKTRVLGHLYLLLLVVVSWAIFAITDFAALGRFLTAMFSLRPGTEWLYYLRNYGVTLLLAAFLSTPLLSRWEARLGQRLRWARYLALGVTLIASIAYLEDATYNPFLYFRF